MKISLPTSLTLLRILFVPLFIIFFYVPGALSEWITWGLFIGASLTDWLDGYLARRLKLESSFGAFLDPVADKLMVVSALILITGKEQNAFLTLITALSVCREIFVSALREWMARSNLIETISVSFLAKCKTGMQMIAISVWLMPGMKSSFLAFLLVFFSFLLGMVSLAGYLRKVKRLLILTK